MSVVMSVKHDVTWDDGQVAPIQPLRLAVSVVAVNSLHHGFTVASLGSLLGATYPLAKHAVCDFAQQRTRLCRSPEFENPLPSPIDPALGQSPITMVANIGDTRTTHCTSLPHVTLSCVQLSDVHAQHELGLACCSTRATACTLAMVTLACPASLVGAMSTRLL
jgi:hypothetical protein